ncbi:thioredoxin [Haloarchaeobius litoreus]|uniref:Thioredoxin n=1 Tax=Haloarchaeobius litoreus TaxID=755306 RepID=A0ABD6DG52_9EURY|nr:thioredoxin [Haloarchaeobius litoreus]
MSDAAESKDDGTDGSPTNTTEPVHVESQEHLQTLLADEDVVLVDFYADWCGPCQMLEPVVAEIAVETDATVAKVDIDELQGLAQENGIRGVPTLLLYADGELVERMVGVQEKSSLVGLIEQHG